MELPTRAARLVGITRFPAAPAIRLARHFSLRQVNGITEPGGTPDKSSWRPACGGRKTRIAFRIPCLGSFQTASGAQVLQSNTLRDSLHPILEDLEHEKGGFNIFRRFRITHLKKSDCPESLQHFWSGHAQKHISERYTQLLTDRQYRLDWAEKSGARLLGWTTWTASRRSVAAYVIENMVDETGIEPATSSLRTRRSPS
jgi:hypothetical protein